MNSVEKIPTGVPGFDNLTYGGIPRGRTTLLAGRSGTCKTVASLQMAANLARGGLKVLFAAVEEMPQDLITSGESLGFGIQALVDSGALILSDLTQPLEGPTFVSGEYDLSGLILRLEGAVREQGVQVVVIDSATALFSPRPPDETLRAQVFQLVSALRRLNVTSILTAEALSDYGPITALGVEDFVSDLVVVLRNIVDGDRRRRSVEVHKYRRSPHFKGEYPCTMTLKGLTVFPLDVKDDGREAPRERYSSGLRGLDEMNSGGWLRDSIVLVRGPSGSGKTTLAGMYARAGAMRGERVMYYGFEEPRPILKRNFTSLGMPLEELEKQGLLHIVCRYPEGTSPEDLLVDLRSSLDAFKPTLVVLDSISAIEHSTSSSNFRQFMIGLAALLREHGRSAMLTQTTAPGNQISQLGVRTAPYLSTLADAILLLDYLQDGDDVQRTLRVLKMRGSSHVTERRRLSIIPGGLRVEPLTPSVPAGGR